MRKNFLNLIVVFVVLVFLLVLSFSFGQSGGKPGFVPALGLVAKSGMIVVGFIMVLLGGIHKLKRIQPGSLSGYSPGTSILQGIGYMLMGLDFFIEGVIGDYFFSIGIGLIVTGFALMSRDRHRQKSLLNKPGQ